MALPASPSAAFPAMAVSPMGMAPQPEAGSVMTGSMNWEPVRKRLLGPDLKDALEAATELREGIEIVHTVEFPLMLSALLPAFSTILAHRTSPSPDTSTVEHKLRNVVLEIISRMPSNEILRPHAPHLVAVALDILNRDYEENALLASRIIFDLYKVYRSLPQDYVQPYLDFVQNSYRALPASVQRNFSFAALVVVSTPGSQTKQAPSSLSDSEKQSSTTEGQEDQSSTAKEATSPAPATPGPVATMETGAAPVATPPSSAMAASPSISKIPITPTPRLSPRSNSSFRVLTECPLVVMLMFQLYPKFLRSNIPGLINVMMEALALRAPSIQTITQGNQPIDANANRLYFSRCRELVAAQAKTLSFLTYLLRGFSNDLKPYEERLASNVVALMSTCPKEFISTRKELLVATRHLLNSEFRNGFYRHVDALLDERVLMGSHHRYSEQTVLRPLGYTTLSDLVHHVRSNLNLNQISKVVSIFSRVLHDSSMVLPMSTQYTAVRTLLSVVDIVYNNKDRDPQIGRDILVRILETLVDKLSALNSCREFLVQQMPEETKNEGPEAESSGLGIIAQLELPVGSDPKESLKDLKSMIRAIIVGHKTLIWYINKYRGQREIDKSEIVPPKPGSNEEVSSAMLKITHTECALIDRYIRLAFPCMKWLKDEKTPDASASNGERPSTDHYRDALSYFAAAFTVLDGYDLRRTLGRRLEDLVDAVTDDATAIVVPRHLLAANATTSFEFCSLLLDFLVERMDKLDTSVHADVHFLPPTDNCDLSEIDRVKAFVTKNTINESTEEMTKLSSAHLQLFERVLKSLSTFPDNERALRPHLKTIVAMCLQASMEKTNFKLDNHAMLLRYVFRSISAGKFEESYRELLPLIPTVLNGLFRIFRATDDPFLHYTIIELLLTIPARLSSLLPHMNLLLRVIISALESSSGDLVNLGLRTLEFWVDNLNPEFLFPEISKQSELFVSLMKALSTHLRPAPYPYGLLTLRLLGKLGGKNRRVLREPMDIKDTAAFKEHASELEIECRWFDPEAVDDSDAMQTSDDGLESVKPPHNFFLPLSIERCVEVIKRLIDLPLVESNGEERTKTAEGPPLLWEDNERLWDIQIEETDLLPYCSDVMNSTQAAQAESALNVLRTALSEMITVEAIDARSVDVFGESSTNNEHESPATGSMAGDFQSTSSSLRSFDNDFQLVGLGLMLGCTLESVREQSLDFAKGFLSNMFLIVISRQDCFVRIDANGSAIGTSDYASPGENKPDNPIDAAGDIFAGSLGSKPFGYFEQTGSLKNVTNPLTVNKSLADMLSQVPPRSQEVGLELLQYVLGLPECFDLARSDVDDSHNPEELNRGSLVFFESLLSALCQKCIISKWNRREGLYTGIVQLLQKMGGKWSRKYEVEVMNVALFSLKSVPKEMSMASVKAFGFVTQVCTALYGSLKMSEDDIIIDVLTAKSGAKEEDPTKKTEEQGEVTSVSAEGKKSDADPLVSIAEGKESDGDPPVSAAEGKKADGDPPVSAEGEESFGDPPATTEAKESRKDSPAIAEGGESSVSPIGSEQALFSPCEDVLQVLVTEMASTKHILRFASRYIIKHYVIDAIPQEKCYEIFKSQMPLIKRVLFSRSLRLLPLPEQVGAVEALATVVDQLPNLIPLNDQHLLAFLSELLKMSSVADGEMTDPNLVGSVVDKNGYAIPSHESAAAASRESKIKHHEKPSSSIFLRRDCILTTARSRHFIPQESPNGVQLRFSSISLLRAVIRGHANPFFDAENSTPIGNIRPHVISLLFRSLVSFPPKCVIAAHDALRDVLSLSVVSDGGKSKSRLRKELLQTCIRPVLLNLRDYSRLSVHLLRGLSRLLSLLSSWFNKTLGEKLLDHLQKWTDPSRMRAQKIWSEGEEPDVAAAIIDLFVLLPHASHFVEPLVKTTIKLEACLPVFQSRYTISPYRKPLARYLNKHCQYTVSFFLQRLKTPLYSEIFQDLITFSESKPLRDYLSGRQSSVSLLNVCFERPLAIIRSEKAASSAPSPGAASPLKSSNHLKDINELFSLHGIQPFTASPTQAEIDLKQEIDIKKKKLQILQQDWVRAKQSLQGKTNQSGANPVPPSESEEAKRKVKVAKTAFDRGTKDLDETKQKYAAELAKSKTTQDRPGQETGGVRPMTIEALELQHQGFRLVRTLMEHDTNYFKDHNDVLRAFRWLWRSKGRYLRLEHEDSVPPRYHDESKSLAVMLVDYSENSPNDVDLLFELIRIFLQPSSFDFSFVRSSLTNAVANLSSSQKYQIMQRFFALLSGESTEEIKTLSIQLVVYPMLYTSFHRQPSKGTDSVDQSDILSVFIDDAVAKKFITEVLFNNGKQISCGDRLKVELLKILNIMLEFVPKHLETFGKDIVKFCLSLLKSEDVNCKSWAYLVLCRHISAMETTSKLILQVYGALIRAHQPEGKEIIRAALDLLVPAMEKRLPGNERKKSIEFTNRIMFEEVNSIPQLAHIWNIVVSHDENFYSNRNQFVRYMINSLTRLGLPPNAPPENRSLSVSVVELVLRWNKMQIGGDEDSHESTSDRKRQSMGSTSHDSEDGHADKKQKIPGGALAIPGNKVSDRSPLLDQTMVDTMINFVVRLKILLADPKLDFGLSSIVSRVDSLLFSIASEWKQCHIRAVYLEKIVAMCQEYNQAADVPPEKEKKLAGKSKTTAKSKPSATSQGTTGNKSDDTRQLSASLLSACLDIFITLADVAPHNSFLNENSVQLNEILASCFHFARKREETELRGKLKRFVVQILSLDQGASRMDVKVIQRLNVLLERLLVDSEMEYRKAPNGNPPQDSARHGASRQRSTSTDEGIHDDGAALFALEVVKEVTATKSSFYKSFSSALLVILNTIVKRHTAAASTKQKQGGVSYVPQSGTSTIRQMHHTPISGILAECSTDLSHTFSSGARVSQVKEPFPAKKLKEFDRSLCTAAIVLEIFGRGDVAYTFTSLRKSFFQILSTILDSSNNVQLLMTAVRIVGRWLSENSGGPLTLKERNSFLWKIASFDFNGLPDVVSQPLADLVSRFVISLLEGKREKEKISATIGGLGGTTPQRFGDSDGMLIGRSLVACLLTANNSLRGTMLSLYLSRANVENREFPESAKEIAETSRQAPVELLWQLLHSDFEGLGGRNWVVLFVEIFLSSVWSLPSNDMKNRSRLSVHRRMPPPRTKVVDHKSALSSCVPELDAFSDSMMTVKEDMQTGGHNFRTAISRLAHGDLVLANILFQTLLPKAWTSVKSDAVRFRLISPIESLLSRSFHSQFLKTGIMENSARTQNVIRTFLNGLALLSPMPVIDVDLLVSLAESYNCWYEVLTILEDQFVVLSAKSLSKSGQALHDKILLAMRHCYRQLGELSVWTSLALYSCNLPVTHRAASLAVHGEIDKALETYTDLVELVETKESVSPTEFEMEFVEERWIDLQREQCQTSVVSEYAKTAQNPYLMLESAWKQREWDRVRALCSSPSLVAAVESGEASVKMCETLLAVANGKLGDVENLHAQTAQLCLYKWQLLPSFSSASSAHASLLHFFHRLVEIRESGQIMVETSNHSTGKTLPDLKNLLNAWRHRLPNDYEELSMWDEIFTWRSHMFSAITSNFSWSEPSTLATLHDRPWTAIRMAMTARKQGMRQTALLLLNRLTDSRSMDVSDAFLKLREQILAYNNPESELERTGGLNLINTTNLSFFDASQMSELFRLKAIFLSSLRRSSKSNQAYCHSVQICPSHSKAWVSWGGLCSQLSTITEKQAEQLAAKAGNPSENSKESMAASAKKASQYLAQAMGCYIEAVQIEANEKARIHLPKCLWILTKDGASSPGVLCQTLESRGAKLPPWVWLPWIPQLLTGLCRAEGRAIKSILSRVVKAYPQAVYYSLRAFYLERRDVERAKGIPSASSQHMPSVAYAEEMMSTLRRSHASLWSSLEAILEELIVKFRPSYEEELLATISALLERAESHAEKQSLPDQTRIEDEDAMVASWSKTLSRIAAKFFRPAADSSAASSRRDERVKKTAEFKRKYKDDFESDFKVNSAEVLDSPTAGDSKPQFRLAEYITRLQKWKTKLEEQVLCTPTSLPLIESSHALAMFAGEPPDLWPGACDTKYLSAGDDANQDDDDDLSRHQSTASSSAAIARKAALNAAAAAASAAAREGVGGEYGGGSAVIEIPGQYCPNSATTADIKPFPELHAKLERFDPFVEVLRRNDQLVRRVSMVGSDGRVYRFLLQFAIPYWTRTDERTAQTNFIIDKFLRQNNVSARNYLSIQPSAAIPVAQRLRMTLDTESRVALDDVFRSSHSASEKKIEAIPDFFLKEVEDKLRSQTTQETTQEDREKLEMSIRHEVYADICKSKVDSQVFLRFVQRNLDGPENLFHFRRAFAGQLASNSLLQYIFSVAERTPPRFVLLLCRALVLSPDFRVSYSNQGFIEGHAIPFRMTPNIETLIGKPYLDGRFIRSIAMVAGAIREHREEFDPILRLLMRDDILAWYSKSLAKTDSKTQELERQLIERVSKNVSLLHARCSECSPTSTKASKEGAIDSKIRELYEAATNTEKLSMMPTNYHPWL